MEIQTPLSRVVHHKIISQTATPQFSPDFRPPPFANFVCKSRGGCRRSGDKYGQVSHRIRKARGNRRRGVCILDGLAAVGAGSFPAAFPFHQSCAARFRECRMASRQTLLKMWATRFEAQQPRFIWAGESCNGLPQSRGAIGRAWPSLHR